jgi:hypothetical protein
MAEDPKSPAQGKKNIDIELSEQEAQGSYSNLVMITHSSSEFVLDFLSLLPGVPKAKVVKRMILTPDHAKRLAHALQENVHRFESEHGEIQAKEKVEAPLHYRGPLPEA